MHHAHRVVWSTVAVTAFLMVSSCSQQNTTSKTDVTLTESFLLHCEHVCDNAKREVKKLGGNITSKFKNIPALVVTLPQGSFRQLLGSSHIKSLTKDLTVLVPSPPEQEKVKFSPTEKVSADRYQALSTEFLKSPDNYLLNSSLTGAMALHTEGYMGEGVIVAVIDSGIANNRDIVPVLADSVIGGENLVDHPDEPSATSTINDPHGTMVASMIAAHGGLLLDGTSPLVQALLAHTPESLIPIEGDAYVLPMLGTAPGASLYALKTFSASGGGAPTSRILLAMDRIITLKKNFLDGLSTAAVSGDGSEDNPFTYEALDIDVVNMSLGGPTLFAGFELDDLLSLEMSKLGISVVASVGNEGPATLTTGSPSTSYGSLAVGAASSPVHERILRELQNGPATGIEFRPTDHLQVATFSSRGPVADGRTGVDLVANGVACFVQGANGEIFLASGTSFSAPTVAGAAALLHGAKPELPGMMVTQALRSTANSELIGGNPLSLDQGLGFIAVNDAHEWLNQSEEESSVDNEALDEMRLNLIEEPRRVRENIQDAGLETLDFEDDVFSTDLELKPGQVKHFFIPVSRRTGNVKIQISNINPALPPEQQNAFFGDDLIVTLVDAPTSIADILFDDFVVDDTVIEVPSPQTGLLRLAVTGDWTNAGNISTSISVSRASGNRNRSSARGKLNDSETDTFQFAIGADTTTLNFNLSWTTNWAYYPSHDLDLIVFDPEGNPYFEGASLRSPELLSIDSPRAGIWTVMVDGFLLHGYEDIYRLQVHDQDSLPITPEAP